MKSEDAKDISRKYIKNSLFSETLSRLKQNRGAVLGAIFLIILILLAVFADFLFDYKTIVVKQNISERLQKPSWEHLFGTDEFGRDMLARVVHGSRISLVVAFSSIVFALLLGGCIGALAGFYGGAFDNILMRITDIVLSIPMTMFAIVIVAALGVSTTNLALAIGIANMPIFARVVRGAVITVRSADYVEAARAIGMGDFKIISKYMLPNCMAPIIVQVTLRIAAAIYNTSALSFLGMGVSAPAPEWGALLSAGRNFIRDSSYLCVIPGIAIVLTVLSLNMIGDGLRDALDPKLR